MSEASRADSGDLSSRSIWKRSRHWLATLFKFLGAALFLFLPSWLASLVVFGLAAAIGSVLVILALWLKAPRPLLALAGVFGLLFVYLVFQSKVGREMLLATKD